MGKKLLKLVEHWGDGRGQGGSGTASWGDMLRIDDICHKRNTDRVVGRINPDFSVGPEEMFICSKNVEIDASDLTIVVLTFYSRRRKNRPGWAAPNCWLRLKENISRSGSSAAD